MTPLGRIFRVTLPAGVAFGLLITPVTAAAQVTVEYFQGTALNLPTPLTIEQAEFPDISVTADYSVRPLDDIFYYALRVGYWREDAGWVVELLHHKIYLENPPADVQSFEVTHGYNMLTLNRGWRRGSTTFLVGAGPVIPHTNSTIRGRHRPITAPYTLAGVAFQGAIGRRFDLGSRLFVAAEGKLTGAWARVPVADGDATAPNVAFHGLIGLGARF
jgi:hypothetical protein